MSLKAQLAENLGVVATLEDAAVVSPAYRTSFSPVTVVLYDNNTLAVTDKAGTTVLLSTTHWSIVDRPLPPHSKTTSGQGGDLSKELEEVLNLFLGKKKPWQ